MAGFENAPPDLKPLLSKQVCKQLAQDGSGYSDNPTFRKEFERIVEGHARPACPNADSSW